MYRSLQLSHSHHRLSKQKGGSYVRSIPRPWSLVKGDLDEHFGFPVVERIEQANEYFKTNSMGSPSSLVPSSTGLGETTQSFFFSPSQTMNGVT
jgi:hypothetical protein